MLLLAKRHSLGTFNYQMMSQLKAAESFPRERSKQMKMKRNEMSGARKTDFESLSLSLLRRTLKKERKRKWIEGERERKSEWSAER